MKNVIAAFGLFFIMVSGILFSINHISNISSDLQKLTEKLEQQINKEDWETAYTTSMKLLKDWKSSSEFIAAYMHHEEIDNINNEALKLTQYTKCQSKEEALATVHAIKFLIEHMIGLEKVNFSNIF